jgi:hypothetical protein
MRKNEGTMTLRKAAWSITTAICLLTSVLLLISDYDGYAVLLLALALSAGINLKNPES